MSDDGIRWFDMDDGIHQKGVRATSNGGNGVKVEAFVRMKPGLVVMEDPNAIVFTNLDYLRTFGHDD